MNTRRKSEKSWSQVRTALDERGQSATATISKASFPHPLDAGAVRASSWPVGQRASYALAGPADAPPLVVHEYEQHFAAAVGGVQLATQVAQAAEQNPTVAVFLGSALVGGAIASSVSNTKQSALVGVGLGLLFAAVLDAALDERRKR